MRILKSIILEQRGSIRARVTSPRQRSHRARRNIQLESQLVGETYLQLASVSWFRLL